MIDTDDFFGYLMKQEINVKRGIFMEKEKHKQALKLGGIALWIGSTIGYAIYAISKNNSESEQDKIEYTLEELQNGYEDSKEQK